MKRSDLITIKELAEELGVTVQAVYLKISELEIKPWYQAGNTKLFLTHNFDQWRLERNESNRI